MPSSLSGKTVAILVTDGFEQVEMTEPRRALDAAGARTVLVSPAGEHVRAWRFTEWGDTFPVDMPLDAALTAGFDALLLPGGVMNPDKLRLVPEAIFLVKRLVGEGKPVAAICHAAWTLISADLVRGVTLTSWPSLEHDLANAGATWVNKAVVKDGFLVSSRNPGDIPEFNPAMIEHFASAPVRAAAE